MTPTAGTTCTTVNGSAVPPDPDVYCGSPATQLCIKCGGEFVIGLAQPGAVHVDFVYLQPGAWGRFAGLPVRKDGVEMLKTLGIKVIRQGGSFADDAAQDWRRWRGPPWLRPSLGCEWGHSLISGWGPFEMADLCNAAGIEPVTNSSATAPLGGLLASDGRSWGFELSGQSLYCS